jgi:hypothetical protein
MTVLSTSFSCAVLATIRHYLSVLFATFTHSLSDSGFMVFLAFVEVRVAKFPIPATSGRVATILQNSVP